MMIGMNSAPSWRNAGSEPSAAASASIRWLEVAVNVVGNVHR